MVSARLPQTEDNTIVPNVPQMIKEGLPLLGMALPGMTC